MTNSEIKKECNCYLLHQPGMTIAVDSFNPLVCSICKNLILPTRTPEPTKAEKCEHKNISNKTLFFSYCNDCGAIHDNCTGVWQFPIYILEPTKAENGLVRLNIDKVANAIRVFDGNHDKGAGQIAEHICNTFGTPSITKEKLLAILPEKKPIEGMLANKLLNRRENAVIDLIEQRIEELFK